MLSSPSTLLPILLKCTSALLHLETEHPLNSSPSSPPTHSSSPQTHTVQALPTPLNSCQPLPLHTRRLFPRLPTEPLSTPPDLPTPPPLLTRRLFPRLDYLKFESQNEIDDKLRDGTCAAALIPRIDFDFWRTEGQNCQLRMAASGSIFVEGGGCA